MSLALALRSPCTARCALTLSVSACFGGCALASPPGKKARSASGLRAAALSGAAGEAASRPPRESITALLPADDFSLPPPPLPPQPQPAQPPQLSCCPGRARSAATAAASEVARLNAELATVVRAKVAQALALQQLDRQRSAPGRPAGERSGCSSGAVCSSCVRRDARFSRRSPHGGCGEGGRYGGGGREEKCSVRCGRFQRAAGPG